MKQKVLAVLFAAATTAAAADLYPPDAAERLLLVDGVNLYCVDVQVVPGGTEITRWECDGQQPTPAELIAATNDLLLSDRLRKCEQQANAALDSAISAELSTTEQIVIRTDPVPDAYAMRRAWVDAQIALHDALVGDGGPLQSVTGPDDLSPCPSAVYQTFDAWESAQ